MKGHPEYSADIDKGGKEEWTNVLKLFDDAIIMQTWDFADVICEGQQVSRMILRRNNETVGLAQVRITTIPLFSRGMAYVAYGPVWRKKGTPFDYSIFEVMIWFLQEEYVRRRSLLLRVTPYIFSDQGEIPVSILHSMGFTRSKQEINYDTIVLDISRSMAEIRKGFKKNWRYYLGLAERNGLEIREGVTRKDYEDFLPVYSDLLDRKGLQPDIDVTRWIKLQHALPESEKPRIFLAFHNGNIVAGLVVSAIGGTGYPIVAASHSEGKKLYGSNLLHWKAIEWLKTMGCHSYDLSGIDPEKNPGTYHFKTGFGGREVSTIGVFEDCTSGMSKAIVRLGEPIRSTVIRFSRKMDKFRIRMHRYSSLFS